MNNSKVLVDLLPALEGFAGIPQESRLLFKILAQQDNIESAGLIYTNSNFSAKYNFNSHTSDRHNLINCANFLAEVAQEKVYSDSIASKKNALYLMRYTINKLKEIMSLVKKRNFPIQELDTEHFFGVLWRLLFSKTLLADDMSLLKKQRYFLSAFNSRSIRVANMLKSEISLNTKDWDFVIFQFMRPVKVSPGTTKIVRYHDSIALQDVDVSVPQGNTVQSNDLLACLNDSFYVCNSEPTRESLLKLAPELENKSATIGLILADYKKILNRENLLNIIRRSLSSCQLNSDKQAAISQQLKQTPDFPYLLIISTLEPRKNHLHLIRAWEKLRAEKKIPHKLIIVGNAGWNNQAILAAMKPHVLEGDILHLEKIMPEEMGYLYSHADAFVFPSFNEGFGCPPLEAMQCECPVIASDIKAHRWVLGDAALYCNPYDVNSLAQQLENLLLSQDKDLRMSLIKKGLERVKKFSPEVIGTQWQELFARLKK